MKELILITSHAPSNEKQELLQNELTLAKSNPEGKTNE